jgi:predicted permease
MSLWNEVVNRLRYLAGRRQFDSAMDDEIQFHIETRAAELVQAGMAPQDALTRARREFGPSARVREETRAAWQFRWLEDLAGDLRYGAGALGRNPAFAATATLCLALGIGANTTMFSIANELLFTTASVRDPQSAIHIQIGGNSHAPLREYRFVRDAHLFEGLAGEHEESEANWRHGDATDRLFVVQVTDNFFPVLGIPLAMGRPLDAENPSGVVVSYGFWQRRLGADPNVLGRNLILDGKPFSIAGVLPRDHRTVTGFGFSPDLYMPVSDEKAIVAFFARMPQGMTRQIAYERLKATCQQLDRVYPDGGHKWADMISVNGVMGLDNFRPNLLPVMGTFGLLMMVVGLVLLIACANVASLLLARASSRTQEIAIRLSIGAGRWRIVRQLLAETLLLATAGTAAGLGLNIFLTTLLSRYQLPLPVPIRFVIDPDWRLLAYAVAVSFACTLAAGLMPAIKGTGSGIGAALKRNEHQVGHNHFTLRNGLVVGQLAASIVLLCAGFIFMRNLVRSASMSPGFDASRAVWASMRLVPERYPKSEQQRALAQAALERLSALPGVEAASIAKVVPLNGNDHIATNVTVNGSPQAVFVQFNDNYVGSNYFRAMGIPIVQGREFLPSDRAGSPRVAIVNETMARLLFGDVSPVGQTVQIYQSAVSIVGVAKNSKYFLLNEQNQSAYYEPYAQWQGSVADLNFLVRTATRPETQIKSINAALGQFDPSAALETKPMSSALAFAMLPSQIGAAILGSTGLLGLLLAAIGLYGTLLYAVNRRVREIGLRVALGATPNGILRLVLRQSAGLVAVGLAIGVALAVFAVRPLAAFLLPDVRPADPANFAAGAAVLCAVALVATVAPAIRALRVDPVVALRHD